MEPKFSPGPWELTEEDTFNVGCRAIVADGEPVAHVETWVDSSEEEDIRARANAHLIASAPEIYEWMKTTVDYLPPEHMAVTKAKELIAKVEA